MKVFSSPTHCLGSNINKTKRLTSKFPLTESMPYEVMEKHNEIVSGFSPLDKSFYGLSQRFIKLLFPDFAKQIKLPNPRERDVTEEIPLICVQPTLGKTTRMCHTYMTNWVINEKDDSYFPNRNHYILASDEYRKSLISDNLDSMAKAVCEYAEVAYHEFIHFFLDNCNTQTLIYTNDLKSRVVSLDIESNNLSRTRRLTKYVKLPLSKREAQSLLTKLNSIIVGSSVPTYINPEKVKTTQKSLSKDELEIIRRIFLYAKIKAEAKIDNNVDYPSFNSFRSSLTNDISEFIPILKEIRVLLRDFHDDDCLSTFVEIKPKSPLLFESHVEALAQTFMRRASINFLRDPELKRQVEKLFDISNGGEVAMHVHNSEIHYNDQTGGLTSKIIDFIQSLDKFNKGNAQEFIQAIQKGMSFPNDSMVANDYLPQRYLEQFFRKELIQNPSLDLSLKTFRENPLQFYENANVLLAEKIRKAKKP